MVAGERRNIDLLLVSMADEVVLRLNPVWNAVFGSWAGAAKRGKIEQRRGLETDPAGQSIVMGASARGIT
jgi:hypothetical protein